MKSRTTLVLSAIVFSMPLTGMAVTINSAASGAVATAAPWGAIPSTGNDYVAGHALTGANSITFAGDSLTLGSGSSLAWANSNNGNYVFTVPGLKFNGGSMSLAGAGAGTRHLTVTAAGGISVLANTTLTSGAGGGATNFTFNSPISGNANLQLTGSATGSANYHINSADSAYTGAWSVNSTASQAAAVANLNAAAAKALGSGTVTLNAKGVLNVNAATGIDGISGCTLATATSVLNLNSNNWTSPAAILTGTAGFANLGTSTVSIGSLAVNAAQVILTVGGTADGKIITAGNADFGTLSGSLLVNIANNPEGKTFDLVTYGGTLVNPPQLSMPPVGRLTPVINNGTGSNDKVTLSFTGSAANLVWKGNDGVSPNSWDTSTFNFDNGGSPDKFMAWDNVLFDSTASSFAPEITGNLVAGTVTFAGATDYTLGGTGSLTGNSSLVKSGTSTLTVSNTTANTYTGSVTINGGTLRAGIASALGSTAGDTTINNGGTLDLNALNLGAEVIKIAGTGVGGNGAIVNSGAQQTQALRFVTLTGDASIGGTGRWDMRTNATLDLAGHKLTKTGANYTALVATTITSGDIEVNDGTLGFDSATTVVNGTGTISVNSGGTLEISYGVPAANTTRDIVLNGGTLSAISGDNGANSNISLTADSFASVTSGTLNLHGAITESGGARSLRKSGASTLILSGTGSTYSGGTTIDGGIVRVDADQALGTGPIQIGLTDLGAVTNSLRPNNAVIDNDITLSYGYNGDYLGTLTAMGGGVSTVNGDITVNPNLSTSTRGGDLAAALDGSVLRLMGELNVGGGKTGISQRNGIVEYGGGSSTAYSLSVTHTARLAANNGLGSLVSVNLGGSADATLDLNGFSTAVESIAKGGFAATITNNGTADSVLTLSSATDGTYAGTITDGTTNKVSIVKGGSSTLTLSGTKTYTGSTTVTGGTLAGTGNKNSPLTVQTGAAIAPGNGIGTFGTANASFAAGSIYKAQINSATNAADKLDSYGDVTLAASAILSLSDLGAPSSLLTVGTTFVLIDYSGYTLTGTFDGIPDGSEITLGANKFLVAYNDVSKLTLTANGAADVSPFASWATTHGLDGSPGKEAGFGDDPEGDGIANGLEWVLGGNPLSQDATSLVTTSSDESGGITLSFHRDPDSISLATLTVEFDTDLAGTWTSTTVGPTTSSAANGVQITVDAVPDPATVDVTSRPPTPSAASSSPASAPPCREPVKLPRFPHAPVSPWETGVCFYARGGVPPPVPSAPGRNLRFPPRFRLHRPVHRRRR